MKKVLIIISILLCSAFTYADTEGLSCWVHYDLAKPTMHLDDETYKGENSWGFSLEYYLPENEGIKFGFGAKYQFSYKLNEIDNYSVHDKPLTYTFTPVYFLTDFFISESVYFMFQAGIGAVNNEESFEEEFTALKDTGYYVGAGVGFEWIEFLYSIDFLETEAGDDASVSRLSLRI